jgi:hypothetical protein
VSEININDIANNPNLSLQIVSTQDENPKDAFIRRMKDITLFFIAIFAVLSLFAFCLYMLMSKDFSSEDKKWGMAVASGILSAFLGYITGRKMG